MILKINDRLLNRKVDFFNSVTLDLKYDSVASSFSFSFYYNPENSEHRQLVCVSHYHDVTIEHQGELLLTGRIVANTFKTSSKRELVSFSGYSLPGVLEDCMEPPDKCPIQFDRLSIRQIAERLLKPFGITMIIDSSVSKRMNEVFETTSRGITTSIKAYLTELCTQKNIVMSNNEKGHIVFAEAKTNQKSVFTFEKGLNATDMSLSFNGQGLHSHITVVKQPDKEGGNAGEFTIRNPYCPIVYRPKVVTQNSGDDNDTEKVARNELAAELKNIVLTINVDRWEIDGKLIRPNIIVSAKSPELYLFNKTDWFVEAVSFSGDASQQTAILTCVLKEVYNGQTPKNVFVSDHFRQNA